MALVIGLTGGIATGKSTVSQMFASFSIPVVDADMIAKQVVIKGEPAYEKIVKTFGQNILQDDLSINRKKLGKIVFASETERQKLNQIVHPAVRAEMTQQRDDHLSAGAPAVVLDIPLLFESQLTHFVDKVIVVYIDEGLQLERLMRRDQITVSEAKQRMAAQLPMDQKVKEAHAVIYNNGTKAATQNQLINILIEWGIVS